MRITAIKQQERLQHRYSVYVDESYSFSLSADTLLQQGLHSGQELDEADLKSLKQLSQDDKAYGLALAYVMRRMRSRWEINDYFRRKDYDPELREQLLSKLTDIGQVDDEKFAEVWVRNRRLLKSVSKRKLTQELRQKRVADGVISKVLLEDDTDERSVLQALIERKRRQTRYHDTMKLMQFLARQGFGYDDIKAALHNSDSND